MKQGRGVGNSGDHPGVDANFKLASQRKWHLNRLKKVNGGTHVDIWGRTFQAEGMPVQRP